MLEKAITGTDGQNVTLKMAYNAANQLTGMTNGQSKIAYSYDKNGSLIQKTLTSKTYGKLADRYAYDALDQLTSYVGYDGYQQQFTYDANGMRLSKKETGDESRSTLEELFRGNIAGQPEIVVPQAQDDAADVPEELAWATTDYLYDITQEYYQVISETRTETNGHTATTAYAYGLERIAAYTADGKTSYVYDGRGSVVQAVTAPVAGEKVSSALPDVAVKVQSFLYTAFGEQMGAQKVSGFAYNAEAYDAATGMINLRARQYEPALGRFEQKDIVRGTAGYPILLNRYLYCRNNGVNYIDPTGESILGALIGPKVIKDTLLGVGLIISGISAGIRTIKNFYKAYNSPTAKLRRQEEKKRREIEWKQERDHILTSNSLCGPAPTPKTTPVPSSYVTSVAGSNAPNPNDHRDDDDKKDTKHGEKRKNERGFTKEKIEDITKNYSQKVYQPGGRTVYAKKTGGYYDVVIYNNEGKIITTVGGNTKSLKTWSDVVRMLNNNGGFSSLPILR